MKNKIITNQPIGSTINFEIGKKEMNKENWEKRFDFDCYFLKGRPAEKDVKDFIRNLLLEEKQKLIEEIENLIAEEMLICNKEGIPTSRLTSLVVKLRKLDK